MPRYRFSETVVYQSGNPWPTYEAGQVYDLTVDFGERWVRRHVAALDDSDDAALPDPRHSRSSDAVVVQKSDNVSQETVVPAEAEAVQTSPTEDIVLPRLVKARRP